MRVIVRIKKNKKRKSLIKVFLLGILVILFLSVVYFSINNKYSPNEETEYNSTRETVFEKNILVETGKTTEIPIPENFKLANSSTLPEFMNIENKNIKISAQKYNSGNYSIELTNSTDNTIYYNLDIQPKPFKSEELKNKISDILGDRMQHYGIYIYDILRDQKVEINSSTIMPPASISKIPIAILALRDIDAGIFSMDTKIPIKNSLKHSTEDSLGQYPNGTKLPIKEFIKYSIIESNNTAQNHLKDFLGGRDKTNARIKTELGVDQFSEDPMEGTAENIFRVYLKIYKGELLSKENNDYLLDLMKNSYPSLREALPSGIQDENVTIANKAGFLFGGQWGDTYSDSAIITTLNTDYIIIILNNKAEPYPQGIFPIQEISTLVYEYLK